MEVTPMGFINEILESFGFYIMFLFQIEVFESGITIGSILVALAVFSLFVRIFVVRLKNV